PSGGGSRIGSKPALRQLYVQAAANQLLTDFAALKREDEAPAHQERIREAEQAVTKLEKKIADHVAFSLLNFRDGKLPAYFRGYPRQGLLGLFGMLAGSSDCEIGVRILEDFAATFRKVAGHHPEEVTVHATAISSLPPDRRPVWRAAYELMQLKPATRRPLYQPRVEKKTTGDKAHKANVWGTL
ncbi:MAG TPA: hypothetical protein VM510_00315, partial [Caulifigura sp.]|nr:hypothetical protein [Caulifigura sp.]